MNMSEGITNISTIYPVGTIHMSVNPANPSTYFGFGTWVSFGAGRVPVGVDTTQTEFDTVKETGGSKTHTLTSSQMPAHNHTINSTQLRGTIESYVALHTGTGVFAADTSRKRNGTSGSDAAAIMKFNADHNHTMGNTGSGSAHNNLQPYITVYMWERTA